MTAIWRNDGSGWSLLAPEGFPDEASLHSLIEKAPELLPLAGARQLTIVGREVTLGSGSADLIGIEPSGRLVAIEVKLARNAEARRAIVAQILAYAAYLKGLRPEALERDVLGRHLSQRGFDTLADAAEASLQAPLDRHAFDRGLAESLEDGRFRLVLVLDEAPEELVRLTGYLESVTDKLLIDLVTVASYTVGGSQVIVPQRVDPEQARTQPKEPPPDGAGRLVDGPQDFLAELQSLVPTGQELPRSLVDWAMGLEAAGFVKLRTYHGKGGSTTLLPWLRADDVGLVTIWMDRNGGYVQFWRSVFERRAPEALPKVEAAASPLKVGQGNVTHEITPELLEALTEAYREAATGRVSG